MVRALIVFEILLALSSLNLWADPEYLGIGCVDMLVRRVVERHVKSGAVTIEPLSEFRNAMMAARVRPATINNIVKILDEADASDGLWTIAEGINFLRKMDLEDKVLLCVAHENCDLKKFNYSSVFTYLQHSGNVSFFPFNKLPARDSPEFAKLDADLEKVPMQEPNPGRILLFPFRAADDAADVEEHFFYELIHASDAAFVQLWARVNAHNLSLAKPVDELFREYAFVSDTGRIYVSDEFTTLFFKARAFLTAYLVKRRIYADDLTPPLANHFRVAVRYLAPFLDSEGKNPTIAKIFEGIDPEELAKVLKNNDFEQLTETEREVLRRVVDISTGSHAWYRVMAQTIQNWSQEAEARR